MRRGWPVAQVAPAVLAGVLALLTVMALLWAGQAPVGEVAAPVAARAVTAPQPGGADANGAMTQRWLAAILARPLFQQNRRPVSAALAAAPPVVMPRLTALVVTAAGARAIFSTADGQQLVAAVGATVTGYTVTAISRDSVQLTGPNGSQILKPSFAPGAANTQTSQSTSQTPAAHTPPSRFSQENE